MKTKRRAELGFGLVELLISLTVIMLAMAGLAGLMIQNTQLNRMEQLRVQSQADARNCLAILVQKLRSAGWNPRDLPFEALTLDPDGLADGTNQIELRADLNSDGDLDDDFEQLLIRHIDDRVEWRRTPDGAFETLAVNITNDADGDGTAELMFVPDDEEATRIEVTVTARSPEPEPRTGRFARYTVSSEVVMRTEL